MNTDAMHKLIKVDGAYGEGGGQVVRTALTLSVLTGRPVAISNIRANRPKPGLAPQHLTNVLALAEICDADVQGAEIGSAELLFKPKNAPRSGEYRFDVTEVLGSGSAGSVTLILQTLLLPLSFAEGTSRLLLRGGTHVTWSPPFEFIDRVFLPTVAKMGIEASCRLNVPGFYPSGGGEITAEIAGLQTVLKPLELRERGKLLRIEGNAIACTLPSHIPHRMAERARAILERAGFDADITPRREQCIGPGAGIFLTAHYEWAKAGFSALGAPGKPSEAVAEEACEQLFTHHLSGAPADRYLADQLLLPMSLADGVSAFETACISSHLLTNAHIIGQFIDAKIDIEGEEGEVGKVTVTGSPGSCR
jgi:RNA 3'-terminal phosphate cyclase (ATP)